MMNVSFCLLYALINLLKGSATAETLTVMADDDSHISPLLHYSVGYSDRTNQMRFNRCLLLGNDISVILGRVNVLNPIMGLAIPNDDPLLFSREWRLVSITCDGRTGTARRVVPVQTEDAIDAAMDCEHLLDSVNEIGSIVRAKVVGFCGGAFRQVSRDFLQRTETSYAGVNRGPGNTWTSILPWAPLTDWGRPRIVSGVLEEVHGTRTCVIETVNNSVAMRINHFSGWRNVQLRCGIDFTDLLGLSGIPFSLDSIDVWCPQLSSPQRLLDLPLLCESLHDLRMRVAMPVNENICKVENSNGSGFEFIRVDGHNWRPQNLRCHYIAQRLNDTDPYLTEITQRFNFRWVAFDSLLARYGKPRGCLAARAENLSGISIARLCRN